MEIIPNKTEAKAVNHDGVETMIKMSGSNNTINFSIGNHEGRIEPEGSASVSHSGKPTRKKNWSLALSKRELLHRLAKSRASILITSIVRQAHIKRYLIISKKIRKRRRVLKNIEQKNVKKLKPKSKKIRARRATSPVTSGPSYSYSSSSY